MQFGTKSIFGKILASENIDVLESSMATTAYFDLENRKLVLPVWEASSELSRMLLGHEVSHAINTPLKGWMDGLDSVPEEERGYFKNIMNVVEDVRIDRLIMEKYPGLRSDYRKGMIELDEKLKFFGSVSVVDVRFLSRLNTHLKYNVSGGHNRDIIFTSEEQYLVDKAIASKTFDDVVEVSHEILKMFPYTEGDTDDNFASGFDKTLSRSCSSNPIDCEIEEENLSEIMEDAMKGTFTVTTAPLSWIVNKSREKLFSEPTSRPNMESVIMMRNAFNRRKSAYNYRNRSRKKTGNLDGYRLHSYSLTDDIFTREVSVPKQKNHVIVMLIDGSSSMRGCMKMVAQKVFEIFEFCRLEKIPFMCYVFNDAEGIAPNIHGEKGGYKLTQYFGSKNSIKEYQSLSVAADGGTPLSSSLVGMFSVLENIRELHSEKKMSFIVMTDGGCTERDSMYMNYRHVKYKANFPFIKSTDGGYNATGPLYMLMRDIFDCKIVSINLSPLHEGLNCYQEHGGANLHFDVSLEKLKNPKTSENKLLIETVMELVV